MRLWFSIDWELRQFIFVQDSSKRVGSELNISKLKVFLNVRSANSDLKKMPRHEKYIILYLLSQLKKLAKKYKTQSEKYQKLLTENKIDFASDLSGAPTASGEGEAANAQPQPPATAQMDPEEKKKLESQLQDRLNTINEITGKLASLQDLLEAEKKEHYQAKEKFETLQKQYIEAEKKLLEQRKETEHAKNELAEEKVLFCQVFYS